MPLTKFRVYQGKHLGYDYDFKTNLTNSEAINTIAGSPLEFAASLYRQHLDRGNLSDRQWYWVHILALEARGCKVR